MLKLSTGHCSRAGRKDVNQDFLGLRVPTGALLATKGAAVALADGVSSSEVSHLAAESAVNGFLEDYYATSETWTVHTAAQRVIAATNAWLYAQTRAGAWRYELERGYVCTFAAVVFKSTTAHLFHVGDTRICRVQADTLEPLTQDHRAHVDGEQALLSRAMGIDGRVDIDYAAVPVESGDVWLLMTDGIHEHVEPREIVRLLRDCADPAAVAEAIVDAAYAAGSPDNLSIVVVRVDALPGPDAIETALQAELLPVPPLPQPGESFDGFRIVREIHVSHRSRVYLAVDVDSGESLVLKLPSMDLRDDPAYRERFLLEDWIARRIDSPYVLRAWVSPRKRNFLYTTTEWIEGQTLAQWMLDHPQPALETVRGIVEQVAKGLRAFHRLEMLHQDLRPENVVIDADGTARLIDFGSVRIAGLMEAGEPAWANDILGTVQYSAPEYFLGEPGTAKSDLFSLAVITYQMLTGQLPYGATVARAQTRAAQRKLHYRSALSDERPIPAWIDHVLRKALHPDPNRRHEDLFEFLADLRRPSRAYLSQARPPLIERDPLRFWQGLSLILALLLAWSLLGR